MFTLNQGFKGYNPSRHFGAPTLFLLSINTTISVIIMNKKALRTEIRNRRRHIMPEHARMAALTLCQKVLAHPQVIAAKRLALFRSFDGEIDTQPIIAALWQQQKEVYLPVLHPFSAKRLLFLRYTPATEMVTRPFGMQEPKLDVRAVLPFKALDIVFTPLVAFDTRGYRIGMGGGYYDRMLANYQRDEVYPIGLAHACQQIAHIAEQPWDIILPEIITA